MKTLLTAFTAALLAAPTVAGDLDAALAAFKSGELAQTIELASAVDPSSDDYARARYLLGETYLLVHDAPSAERAFGATLEKRPQAVPALVGLSRALLAQDQADEAVVHARAAVELEAADAAARRTLGEILLLDEETRGEAREILEALYAQDAGPANTRAYVRLLVLGDALDEALKAADRLAESRAKHPMGPFLRGLVLERVADEEGAIASYREAIARDERFLDAHKNLAILGHTLSDTYQIPERNELALAHYARYFELGGRDPRLQSTYTQLKGFLRPQ